MIAVLFLGVLIGLVGATQITRVAARMDAPSWDEHCESALGVVHGPVVRWGCFPEQRNGDA